MVAAMGGLMNQSDFAEMKTEVIQVPLPMVPMIMGRGAEHVKKIQEVYGVNVRVEKDNEASSGSMLRDVTIRGREEMVTKAKEVIETMVQTGNADIIRSMQTSRDGFEMVPVPRDRVGLVVPEGQQFKSYRSVQAQQSKWHEKVIPSILICEILSSQVLLITYVRPSVKCY